MTKENDYLSKLEMFNRASKNFDNNNLMLQFRAIRLISGLSKDNPDLLSWMCENHFNVVEEIVEKLTIKSLKENDIAIVDEAKAVIEIFVPYFNNHKTQIVIELKCDKCGEGIYPGWNVCSVCGSKIHWDPKHTCPDCKKAINPNWKLCPECGCNLKKQYCSGCNKKLDPSWKLCPYCGIEIS